MSTCHFCSIVCKRTLPICLDIDSHRFFNYFQQFVELPDNNVFRKTLISEITPFFKSNVEFICTDNNFKVCNKCLSRYDIIDDLMCEYSKRKPIHYPLEKFKDGVTCTSCGTLSSPEETLCRKSTEYGVYKKVDEYIESPKWLRNSGMVRAAVLTTYRLQNESYSWYVLAIPDECLFLCSKCMVLAHTETPGFDGSKCTKIDCICKPSQTTAQPLKEDLPYIKSRPSEFRVSMNESSWKIVLDFEGQGIDMRELSKRSQILIMLDWDHSTFARPAKTEINDDIIQRLEFILGLNNINLYARYLLEFSGFGEENTPYDKLVCLFDSLLSLYVTEKTFPAFAAVYFGLWNLCTSINERKYIAKITLSLLPYTSQNAIIFDLLSKSVNLLSFYDHIVMLEKLTVDKEIWGHNYSKLIHLAKMRRLESYSDSFILAKWKSEKP